MQVSVLLVVNLFLGLAPESYGSKRSETSGHSSGHRHWFDDNGRVIPTTSNLATPARLEEGHPGRYGRTDPKQPAGNQRFVPHLTHSPGNKGDALGDDTPKADAAPNYIKMYVDNKGNKPRVYNIGGGRKVIRGYLNGDQFSRFGYVVNHRGEGENKAATGHTAQAPGGHKGGRYRKGEGFPRKIQQGPKYDSNRHLVGLRGTSPSIMEERTSGGYHVDVGSNSKPKHKDTKKDNLQPKGSYQHGKKYAAAKNKPRGYSSQVGDYAQPAYQTNMDNHNVYTEPFVSWDQRNGFGIQRTTSQRGPYPVVLPSYDLSREWTFEQHVPTDSGYDSPEYGGRYLHGYDEPINGLNLEQTWKPYDFKHGSIDAFQPSGYNGFHGGSLKELQSLAPHL